MAAVDETGGLFYTRESLEIMKYSLIKGTL